MRKGRWWRRNKGKTTCLLCPHRCSLDDGAAGLCGVRRGSPAGIVLPSWGMLTAESLDPVEKKPLYHFHPGNPVWSMGFAGCNMDCPFCQNHSISSSPDGKGYLVKPEESIHRAMKSHARMIAFTYSEPGMHAEYLIETAQLAQKQKISTVLVTNGCVNPNPAAEILSYMDGVNIDLKSWSRQYYKDTLKGRLETVREFIKLAQQLSWMELTTLIVPDDNDSDEMMHEQCSWIAGISPDIPLHLSAYYPSHHYSRPATSEKTLTNLADIARQYLNYVYIGNIGIENHTHCPECQDILIRRRGYKTECSIMDDGLCPNCSHAVPGVFN